MISLHKLHSHVLYEEIYQYKRYQKFSIKTITRIACPNFKSEQKIGLSTLEVKHHDLKNGKELSLSNIWYTCTWPS